MKHLEKNDSCNEWIVFYQKKGNVSKDVRLMQQR